MASDTSVDITEFSNPYSVLGVSTNSSHEEIKRAYQRLVLKFHPDKLDESLTREDGDKAYETFLAIDRAWKLLNDKHAKTECDRLLKEQKLSQHWPISAEVDLDDMDYHEDQGSYSTVCRCSGEFLITQNDLENGRNIVCCSDCSFSIRVLYSVIPETSDGEDELLENKS